MTDKPRWTRERKPKRRNIHAEVGKRQLREQLRVAHEEKAHLRRVLKVTRDELARWGWGDFHYGEQPQDERVVKVLAVADHALGEVTPIQTDP